MPSNVKVNFILLQDTAQEMQCEQQVIYFLGLKLWFVKTVTNFMPLLKVNATLFW
jgi:hypothetical protein